MKTRPYPLSALGLVALGLVACDAGSGPGGLRIRDGVTVVHSFEPVSIACLTESPCPQNIVPEIADVVHRGRDWLILYNYRVWVDPGIGDWAMRSGYFVSRDDGATWSVPDFSTITPPYGPRIVSLTLSSGQAFPTALFVAGGEIYQVVPAEMELGTGIYTWDSIYRIDLDAGRIVQTSTARFDWLHIDRDAVASYAFNGESPGMPTYWYRFDPATDPWTAGFLEESFENYVAPPRRGSCVPPVWRETGRLAEQRPVYGGHCSRQYLASTPAEHCWFTASPPTTLQPDWACVPETDWPVPTDLSAHATTLGITGRFGGVMWNEGVGAAAMTRAVSIASTATTTLPVTYDVGPGEPLYTLSDANFDSRAFGGVDHPRWADLVALSAETSDGGRRTTTYRFTGRGFAATSMPTRPCADGVDCGYRPIYINDGSFFPSVLQWATRVSADTYRLFYVVDVATESESRVVVLTSVEHLEHGPATPGSDLERACVLEQGCLGGAFDVAQCVRSWLSPAEATQAALDRFLAARTCAQIQAVDPAAFAPGRPCASAGVVCQDGVAYSCDGATILGTIIDCARSGATCSVRASGDAACAPSGVDCETFGSACDASGRAVLCGPSPVLDCAAAGTECALNTSGYPECTGRFAACTAPAQTVCDGARTVNCEQVGVGQVSLDCARAGLGCEVALGYAGCSDGSGACDASFSPTCDGSQLVYCLDTSLRSVDCASLGRSCAIDGSGRGRCVDATMPPPMDAGPPPDTGGPTCGSAALAGAPLPETETATYPTATGGTIADGTYVLTSYELWSSTAQPYTHRETLVIHGSTFERTQEHSLIGTTTTSGSLTTSGTDLTLDADCPAPMPETHRYIVSGSTLVLLQSSFIRTFTRM